MSKTKKHKIARLTEEQYRLYVTTLREDAALYAADGTLTTPPDVTPTKTPEDLGE